MGSDERWKLEGKAMSEKGITSEQASKRANSSFSRLPSVQTTNTIPCHTMPYHKIQSNSMRCNAGAFNQSVSQSIHQSTKKRSIAYYDQLFYHQNYDPVL